MENVIHAHELLNLLMDSNKDYTMKELEEIVPEKFGKDVEFTNCTGNIYTLNEILDFFKEKNKVVIKDGKISVNKENICNHQ